MYRLTALVFLFAVFGYGSCLNCYQCNTAQDRSCGDPFSNKNYVNCDASGSLNYNSLYLPFLPQNNPSLQTPKVCAKITLQNKSVVRTCLPAQQNCDVVQNAAIQQSSGPVPYRVEHCMICNKDYCNGAASMIASPLAVFAVLAALYYKH